MKMELAGTFIFPFFLFTGQFCLTFAQDMHPQGNYTIIINATLGADLEVINETSPLTILGLFDLNNGMDGSERTDGKSELAAAELAIQHINARGLLSPYYHLQLLTNNTQCDSGVGVDTFFHALYTRPDVATLVLLGSACSEVTESLAKIVPYWNILQVSFGSTSPALSDQKEFPLFYRTVSPDSSHNPAIVAFVHKYGWDTVTAFSQNEDMHTMAINDLVRKLERANVICKATVTFALSDLREQMVDLREKDARVIVGSFSAQIARHVFCEIYLAGMYGPDYAWILHGNPYESWWSNSSGTDCTQRQIAKAAENVFLVHRHSTLVQEGQTSISGLNNRQFADSFPPQTLPLSPYVTQTYDAVWAIALTLQDVERRWRRSANDSRRLAHFHYGRRDMTQDIFDSMGRRSFRGVSGPLAFSGADRVGISAFYQVQGSVSKKLALFYPSKPLLDFSCPQCNVIRWPGGQMPIARRVFRLRVVTVARTAFVSIAILSSLGIIFAVSFLAFNIYFAKLKFIKLSSPRLNNMAAMGCILVYTAVIILGLDHATLPTPSHFDAVCTARAYLLSAGFSLAFGSMFTKTYRVHRLFTRSQSGVVKNKLLQDTQLISLVVGLLLLDCLLVTLWVAFDPMKRHMQNLTMEISQEDRTVVYLPQVEVCKSQHTSEWLGAMYFYKGLLLVVGVYMAWETRQVKIPALNDSQYIGLSVYNVVLTSVIVVVLANLLAERATLAFVTVTTLIFTSTTTTLCLLFLPKIHTLWSRDDGDPIVECMGLKIECNTRRFVIDEKRERHYRAEVQNRVYKREIEVLDHEIGRLERILRDSPPTTSLSASTTSMCDSFKRVIVLLLSWYRYEQAYCFQV